jgi:hypothetical protein
LTGTLAVGAHRPHPERIRLLCLLGRPGCQRKAAPASRLRAKSSQSGWSWPRPKSFRTLSNAKATLLADLQLKHRLPEIFALKGNVVAGGLMSYGVDPEDLYRRAANYIDKILKGTKPADVPVEQASKYLLVVNLKTAKAPGLSIPPTVLARADEVIE